MNNVIDLRSNYFGWFLQDLFDKRKKPKQIVVVNVDDIEIHEGVSIERSRSEEIFHENIDVLLPSKEKICGLIDPNTLAGRILLQIISPARYAQLIAPNRNKSRINSKQVDNRNNVSLMDELISVGAGCVFEENKCQNFVEKPEVDSAYVSDFDCESDSDEARSSKNCNLRSFPKSRNVINIKENFQVSFFSVCELLLYNFKKYFHF